MRDPAWQPITDATGRVTGKVEYILITDGVCVPDLVCWHYERPEGFRNHVFYHKVPAGWFCVNGGRSRLDGKATLWAELPEWI
jgi:hypothetical protein